MSWRDNLLPASFRGASFFYLDTDFEGGRRLVIHEFPLVDSAYVEDLGKRNRVYKLQAYVIGDDYFDDRDALLAALEADGAGNLSHPYLGQLTVNVRKFRVKETLDGGRTASFELTFVDAGIQPSPTSATDTQDDADTSADDMSDQVEGSFSTNYTVAGQTLSTTVAAAAALVDSAISKVDVFLIDARDLALANGLTPANVQALANAPASFAASLTTFAAQYAQQVLASVTPFDDTTSSRGPLPPADPSYGLATLAAWGNNLAPASSDIRTKNQAAIVALVQGAAIVALAKVYAGTTFSAQQDADTARTQIADLIDTTSTIAADAGDNAAFLAYMDLARASANDLTTRGKQVPLTVNYNVGDTLPALYLAERFYGDATRAGELIARNAAVHPLFMPANGTALAS